MRCPSCQHEIPEDARFCQECGARVGPGAASAAEAERRQLTVLFCDLVDSTRLASEVDPEDWHEVVQLYQQEAGDVIDRLEGHVAQYLGDGLLVYFGFPQAHEDDAERAVRAALDIVEAVRGRNEEIERRFAIRLQVRAGIHTGPVVVGQIGAGERRETLALGETTNVAARLQEVAEPDTVVLSAATLRLAPDAFVTHDLGSHALKGLGEMQVHQAVVPVAPRESLVAPASAGDSPLVGRQAELSMLEERFALARSGQGQTVLIVGEAGVGKTRLVRAFRDLVAEQAEARLGCRCSPFGRNTPFHPVVELLRQQLEIAETDPPDVALPKLEAPLRDAGIDVEEGTALLSVLLKLGSRGAIDWSPELQRARTLDVLVTLVLRLARERPALLLVEDLHWADPSTLELLGLLIARAPGAHLMTLLTTRPEFDPPWGEDAVFLAAELGRLSVEETCQIANALSPSRALPKAALDSIVARADGIPLYVEEITKEVLESGMLVERGGQLELEGDVEELSIPTTLQDSLMARLDRLSAAKTVAQVAATLGRDFSYDTLLAIADMDEATVRHGLARLVEAELLFERGTPPDASYTFKHALIQDTAYESLLRSTRQRLHGRIAGALEAANAGSFELLAHHYDRAGLLEKALVCYKRAGDEARARASNQEAAAHLRRGVELSRRLADLREGEENELAFQLALGSTLHALHGLAVDDTFQAWSRSRELCERVGTSDQLGAALRGLTAYYDGMSELHKACELCEDLLALGRETGDESHLLAGYSGAGVSRFWQGHFRRCLEDFEAALEIYDPERHPQLAYVYGMDQAVEAYGFSGWALWVLGYPDKATARVERAVEHARAQTHSYSLAYALMLKSVSYMSRGEWAECERSANECMEVSLRHGFPLFEGVAHAMEALVRAVTTGEDTLATAAEGLAGTAGAGQQSGTPAMLWVLARIHRACGRPQEAIGLIDGALAMSAQGGQPFFDPEFVRFKGDVLLEQGDDEGEALVQRALEMARKQEAHAFELRAATTLAALWHGRGRSNEARALLAPTYGWFTEGFQSQDLRDARELLAELG